MTPFPYRKSQETPIKTIIQVGRKVTETDVYFVLTGERGERGEYLAVRHETLAAAKAAEGAENLTVSAGDFVRAINPERSKPSSHNSTKIGKTFKGGVGYALYQGIGHHKGIESAIEGTNPGRDALGGVSKAKASTASLAAFQEPLRVHLPRTGRDAETDPVLAEEILQPSGLVEGTVRNTGAPAGATLKWNERTVPVHQGMLIQIENAEPGGEDRESLKLSSLLASPFTVLKANHPVIRDLVGKSFDSGKDFKEFLASEGSTAWKCIGVENLVIVEAPQAAEETLVQQPALDVPDQKENQEKGDSHYENGSGRDAETDSVFRRAIPPELVPDRSVGGGPQIENGTPAAQAGAGFGDPAENKLVETAAVRAVVKHYEGYG